MASFLLYLSINQSFNHLEEVYHDFRNNFQVCNCRNHRLLYIHSRLFYGGLGDFEGFSDRKNSSGYWARTQASLIWQRMDPPIPARFDNWKNGPWIRTRIRTANFYKCKTIRKIQIPKDTERNLSSSLH